MVLPKFHTKAKSAKSPPPKDGSAARHRSPAKGEKVAVLEADKKGAADKKSLVEERQGRTVRRRTIGKQKSGGAVKATDPSKLGSATREEGAMKRRKEGSAKERSPREQEGAAKEPSDSNEKGVGAATEVDSAKNGMCAAKVTALIEASAKGSAEVSGKAAAREAGTKAKRIVTKAKRTVMKAKRVSRLVARGRFARALVLRCKMLKTAGGLTAESLMRNKRGKIVSKRKSALGKRLFHHIEPWLTAVMKAREALHVKGFVAINGKSLLGKALYLKAKAIRAEQDS